eukprot:142545-Rhodomonas_salina.1
MRLKQPRLDAAERCEKLFDFLVREEKSRQQASSMLKAIVAVLQSYLLVLHDILVEQGSDSDAVEAMFLKLGKLRSELDSQPTLYQQRGIKLTVHASMDWTMDAGHTPTSTVTLQDKSCPFIRLFRAACTQYCKLKALPYNETAQNGYG